MNDLIFHLAVSLSIGLLVGLERGWRLRDEPAGSRTAGIRTYGISGLLGGIFAALADTMGTASIFSVGFLGFAFLFGWFHAREAEHDKSFSVTGVVAGLCVFALGGLAVSGDYRTAAASGVALAALLASREILHEALQRLTWQELRSALILAVMTMIILPLLPNRAIDPWGGLNPWEVWLFTVLTAAISYLGYIATRIIGAKRGHLVSGLTGGLISSTALTVAFAHIARSRKNIWPLSGAAALAAMVSILRVLVIVLILEVSVFFVIAPIALAAAATFGGCGFFFLSRSADKSETKESSRNPFQLVPLLLFAVGFGVMSMLSAALVSKFGDASLLVTSAFSGLFDVDVAVLSALRLIDHSMALSVVGHAVLVGLLANAIGRLFLGIVTGPRAYWMPLAGATFLAIVVATGVYLLTLWA
jgi:uncharacterized membrane protein (DUF4010 family)